MKPSTAQAISRDFTPEKIWILGAGFFGYTAAQRLYRRYPHAAFTVTDREEEKLERIRKEFGLPVHVEDAVTALVRSPVPDDVWIIPAVPVHVAFQWLLRSLARTRDARFLAVPDAVDAQVPNPYRVPGGTLYASFATFRCPDTCNEPDALCTHTGKERPGNLFEVLSRISLPGYSVIVARSHQLAPGVGGYPGSTLNGMLEEVARTPGATLIATSCRCHGVIDALEWRPNPER